MSSITTLSDTDSIQLWYGCSVDYKANYQHYWQLLSVEEQRYVQQLKHDNLRRRYVIVHGQLRALLAQILQQAPQSIRIAKAVHGKPYLVDYPALAFNLSHTHDVFVIAFAWSCQLGIDLEVCKPRMNMAALAKRCFSSEEMAYWFQLAEAEKILMFYRFWTRKEAFVKAIGRGIAVGLQQCVINPNDFNTFLRIPAECGQAAMWHLQEIELSRLQSQTDVTIYCSLCSDKKLQAMQLKAFDTAFI